MRDGTFVSNTLLRSLALWTSLGTASACGDPASGSADGAGGADLTYSSGPSTTSGTSMTSGTGATTTSSGASTTGSGGTGSATTANTSTGGSTTGTSAATGGGTSSAAGGSGGGSNEGGSSAGGASVGGASSSGGGAGEGPVTWPLINGVQWADTDGNPIQAHGGGMLQVGEDYYWFGENRNPDGTFYAVSAYRSRDLRRWEHVHDVLTMNSDAGLNPANVERPKVVYNATTQRYVMWMHWENGMDYGEARAAVASSDSVTGDYTYHGSFRPFQDSGVVDHDKPGYMSRDCTLFVDDDGQGYFLSTSNENYDLHLYLLSEDYLGIESLAALLFEGEHREAPALFKRGDVYFLVTSGSTGWDPNQAKYATSTSLTSGWSSLQNVADGTTFYSQSTYVLPVQGTGGTEYLYMGDRWAGAWDGRVNDSAYLWQPISFPSDTNMSMSWFDTLDMDASAGSITGSVNAFVFINKKSGMVLSVAGAADQNSADVIQEERASASNPAWRLDYNGAGHFRIKSDSSGKVLDVPDESTESGVDLQLWDDNGGDHQAWRVVDLGRGEYRIRNENSGHSLGVAGGSSEPAAAIQQQSESGGDEQVWQIVVAE